MIRAKENTKSGLLAALVAGVVEFFQFFASDLGYDIRALFEPDHMKQFIEGVRLWLITGFGIGAVFRDQLSPRQNSEPGLPTTVVTRQLNNTTAPVVIPNVQVDPAPVPAPIGETDYQSWVLNGGPIDPTRRYGWEWSPNSLRRQQGVESAIVELLTEAMAICPFDVGIAYLGGLRILNQQKELFVEGTQTSILNSRHLHGYALDVVMYDSSGNYTKDFRYYAVFNLCVAIASKRLNIGYRWGGDWKSRDGAHFELLKSEYPDKREVLAQLTANPDISLT